MKNSKTKREKSPAKKQFIVTTDSESGLPVPVELVREMGLKIGDEFATWKEGDDIIVVFTKNHRGKRKIPEHAYRGKVEPAFREITVTLPMPVKKPALRNKAAR
jgi:hypothetical protein